MNEPSVNHTARGALLAFADRLAAEDIPTQDDCVEFARQVAEEYPGGEFGATEVVPSTDVDDLRDLLRRALAGWQVCQDSWGEAGSEGEIEAIRREAGLS